MEAESELERLVDGVYAAAVKRWTRAGFEVSLINSFYTTGSLLWDNSFS